MAAINNCWFVFYSSHNFIASKLFHTSYIIRFLNVHISVLISLENTIIFHRFFNQNYFFSSLKSLNSVWSDTIQNRTWSFRFYSYIIFTIINIFKSFRISFPIHQINGIIINVSFSTIIFRHPIRQQFISEILQRQPNSCNRSNNSSSFLKLMKFTADRISKFFSFLNCDKRINSLKWIFNHFISYFTIIKYNTRICIITVKHS